MALKTLEEFTVEAQAEIDALKTSNGGEGLFYQNSSGRHELTDERYEQIVIDRANIKLDKQDNDYKKARLASYPEWREQLDMLYHDMAADKGDKTGDWFAAVKKVKDDNPKPS